MNRIPPVARRQGTLRARAMAFCAATVAALAGCGGGTDVGCLLCGPFGATLGGSLSGLIGSGLTLQNGSAQSIMLSGPTANGSRVFIDFAGFNSSYDVTVKTQPTNPSQTCVVVNGTGVTPVSSNVTNIAVTCMTNPPRFVYVTNSGVNTVSAYAVDVANGALAPVAGSPFVTGSIPIAVAVDVAGTYAYVVNQADATVSAFAINRTSGALTAIGGSPFPTGPAPTSAAINPANTFVYVTNGNASTVSVYAINADGTLTAIAGSPFATGGLPSSVAANPSTRHVYVGNQSDGTVSDFSSATSGALIAASGSPLAAGTGPRAVSVDHAGQYLYVANAGSNTLSGYGPNSSTGAIERPLTALTSSPFVTGSNPSSVAIDPTDRYVFVGNKGSNDVSAYALGANGALTALAGSPFAVGAAPSALAVDPTGRLVFVASVANAGIGNVSVFAINPSTGALSAVGGPYAAGSLPSAIAVSD